MLLLPSISLSLCLFIYHSLFLSLLCNKQLPPPNFRVVNVCVLQFQPPAVLCSAPFSCFALPTSDSLPSSLILVKQLQPLFILLSPSHASYISLHYLIPTCSLRNSVSSTTVLKPSTRSVSYRIIICHIPPSLLSFHPGQWY